MDVLRLTQRGYTALTPITEGGFGAVYRAEQSAVRRLVALKVIKSRWAAQPDFIRRFEEEAATVARLEHPHIVPLYDFWRDPSGAVLVLRWMPGGTLADMLRPGAPPLATALRILTQVASALAYAHRMGVIHRDLKPANILLDAEGQAYLSDFGIARDTQQHGDAASEAPSYTLGYAAPEQIALAPPTPQMDLYSLGIVAYELLTGQRAFQGTPEQILQQQLIGSPLDLPDLLPGTGAQAAPETIAALRALVQHATAREPAVRTPDLRTFLAELRLVTGESSAPASTPVDHHPVGTSLSAVTQLLDTTDIPNPYKGLRAFQAADARDFFGRDTLIARLVARMAESDPDARFLAVVGPSGSGKSSVVRAGLVPALRRGALPGAERWFILPEIIPGARPLEPIETALLRIAVNPPASLLTQLQEDPRGLLRAVQRCLPDDPGIELLLVLDQFEEVFTMRDDPAARTHLLESLATAVRDPASRLRLIVTLRADYYDRPLLDPLFGELLRRRTEVVLPLNAEELHAAIMQPAARVGLHWEAGLVERIQAELAAQPGALPHRRSFNGFRVTTHESGSTENFLVS